MLLMIAVLLCTSLPGYNEAAALKSCTKPNLPDVRYNGTDTQMKPGSSLTVNCKEEYRPAAATIICQNGKWSSPQPPCSLVECPFPHQPTGGRLQPSCRRYNCSTTYFCPEGSWYNGTETIYCQRNGHWTGVPGECEETTCPPLPDPPHGRIHQPYRNYRSVATVECDEGYFYTEPDSNTQQCRSNKTWSMRKGICGAVGCPELSHPEHGKVLQPDRSYLAKATIQCDKGYNYSNPGSVSRQCLGNKSWSGVQGTCEKVSCPDIDPIKNGILVSSSGGQFEDGVQLQCQSGYSLDGPSTAWCQSDGLWSTKFGQCIPNKSVDILPFVVSPILALLVVGIAVLMFIYKRSNRFMSRSADARYVKNNASRRNQNFKDSMRNEQDIPLLDIKKLYCSFVIEEDFSKEYSDVASPDFHSFQDNIIKEVTKVFANTVGIDAEVTVTHLCKESRTVYIKVLLSQQLSNDVVTDAVTKATFTSCKVEQGIEYHVQANSIVSREKITHMLAAAVDVKRHQPDRKGDKRIDIDKQYVRLKILSTDSMETMHRDELERPDVYQRGLEIHGGQEISDEELLLNRDYQKYILIRGRAGIGKSTLVQRLLWKWSTGDWATQMMAIFLINIRHLVMFDRKMDLAKLLCLYSVYNTHSAGVIFDSQWLEKNQGNVGFVFDGIDEVRNFSVLWGRESVMHHWSDRDNNKEKIPPLSEFGPKTPLEWCFALMKKDILKTSTVIISTRPFKDLCLIMKHIKNMNLTSNLRVVELMGLTRNRVFEFVDKNAHEKPEFVKQTLVNNPILLSVCAITFYCAALCQVLSDRDILPTKLTTYTQITAYIILAYINRSIESSTDDLDDESKDQVTSSLKLLSQLAFDGLLSGNVNDGSLPMLVFDKQTFSKLNATSSDMQNMRQIGLLMETDIPSQNEGDESDVLRQFVHLSIQEFLAMAGLLSEDPQRAKGIVTRLSSSEQFNMALLFLYGLAFDNGSENVGNISTCYYATQEQRRAMMGMLQSCIAHISSDLQALQLSHESQSVDVAREVGRQKFCDGVISVKGVKLTVIDIIAMVFMLSHQPALHTLRLEHVGLDNISVGELCSFLKGNTSITMLELTDDSLDDTCLTGLTEVIRHNMFIQTFSLLSDHLSDDGLTELADALKENSVLQSLSISSKALGDNTLNSIADALRHSRSLKHMSLASKRITSKSVVTIANALKDNPVLERLRLTLGKIDDAATEAIMEALANNTNLNELRLHSSGITDKGVKAISRGLTRNNHLEQIWLHGFRVGEEGAKAILDMLTTRKKIAVMIWEPKCGDEIYNQVIGHKQIQCD